MASAHRQSSLPVLMAAVEAASKKLRGSAAGPRSRGDLVFEVATARLDHPAAADACHDRCISALVAAHDRPAMREAVTAAVTLRRRAQCEPEAWGGSQVLQASIDAAFRVLKRQVHGPSSGQVWVRPRLIPDASRDAMGPAASSAVELLFARTRAAIRVQVAARRRLGRRQRSQLKEAVALAARKAAAAERLHRREAEERERGRRARAAVQLQAAARRRSGRLLLSQLRTEVRAERELGWRKVREARAAAAAVLAIVRLQAAVRGWRSTRAVAHLRLLAQAEAAAAALAARRVAAAERLARREAEVKEIRQQRQVAVQAGRRQREVEVRAAQVRAVSRLQAAVRRWRWWCLQRRREATAERQQAARKRLLSLARGLARRAAVVELLAFQEGHAMVLQARRAGKLRPPPLRGGGMLSKAEAVGSRLDAMELQDVQAMAQQAMAVEFGVSWRDQVARNLASMRVRQQEGAGSVPPRLSWRRDAATRRQRASRGAAAGRGDG